MRRFPDIPVNSRLKLLPIRLGKRLPVVVDLTPRYLLFSFMAIFGQFTHILPFLVLTAFAAGLSRGFSGFGAALIFVPVASRLVGPQLAAAILLITDAVMAAPMVFPAWQVMDRRAVGLMLIGGLVGIPLGTAALALGDPLTLRWIIVALAAVMLMLLLSGWRYRGTPHSNWTIGVGAVSGVFTGLAQIGGPPVVAYWLGGAAPAATARASIIVYFVASSVVGFVTYLVGGLLTAEVFSLSLLAGPAYGAGLWLGSRLFGNASDAQFRNASLVLIAIAVILGLPLWESRS